MVSIDARPAEVAARTVPGHWEGDLLVGHANASALGTLVERTTRFTLLVPLKAKHATAVRQAFVRAVRTLPSQLRRSLTYDQGQEMRDHRRFATPDKDAGLLCASPLSLGTGHQREHQRALAAVLSRRNHFNKVSRGEIKRVQTMLNDRPRKILNWHSPAHAFHHLLR